MSEGGEGGLDDTDVRIVAFICRLLSGHTLVRVKTENEMFKRNIMEREKEQKKEYRKMREGIKKKEQQIEKQVSVMEIADMKENQSGATSRDGRVGCETM